MKLTPFRQLPKTMLLLKPTAAAPPQRHWHTNNRVEQNWEAAWNLLMTVCLLLCMVFALVYGAYEFVQNCVCVSKIEGTMFICVYICDVFLRMDAVSLQAWKRDYAFENCIVDEHIQPFMNVLRWSVCVITSETVWIYFELKIECLCIWCVYFFFIRDLVSGWVCHCE